MDTTRLQDDLLQEYKAERKLINEQLHLLDPLAVSLRKPAAQRLLNKGALITCEIVFYLLTAGAIAFAVLMDKLPPFDIISKLRYQGDLAAKLGAWNVELLYFGVLGLVVIIALLSFIVARSARRFRQKNGILDLAGKHMKDIVGQQLARKAAIETIDQRHFQELPDDPYPARSVGVNSIPNPGYGG